MATRRELQKLACLRLKEAEALFDAGCYDGCAYLCGYVVELALKAALCAAFEVDNYPDQGSRLREALKTHDLEDLKLVASIERGLPIGRPLANGDLSSDIIRKGRIGTLRRKRLWKQ
jgi:HEPN domain-containing protein